MTAVLRTQSETAGHGYLPACPSFLPESGFVRGLAS
ncbi:predicted protein [Sclerotinia sclerotiorum 1980 UF-70]|uniref:Uncharacterized protein n=1 Tax=Sclerotinia sclerotiorum (strain ATCC 18683 / 1980 / Ss-1) TaxID=665079 RepID=A7EZB8_SCLS1|nr:predicted protein [Sclerotinia sclerotiorum 1980 UF-70]EDN94810.1 predicted protein [Sclerotinia sclerotiorum 1980 UF-70]